MFCLIVLIAPELVFILQVHGLLWISAAIIGLLHQRERRHSIEAKLSFPTTRRTQPSSSRPGRDVLEEDVELDLAQTPPVPPLRLPRLPETSVPIQKAEVQRSWAALHLNPMAILDNAIKSSVPKVRDNSVSVAALLHCIFLYSSIGANKLSFSRV